MEKPRLLFEPKPNWCFKCNKSRRSCDATFAIGINGFEFMRAPNAVHWINKSFSNNPLVTQRGWDEHCIIRISWLGSGQRHKPLCKHGHEWDRDFVYLCADIFGSIEYMYYWNNIWPDQADVVNVANRRRASHWDIDVFESSSRHRVAVFADGIKVHNHVRVCIQRLSAREISICHAHLRSAASELAASQSTPQIAHPTTWICNNKMIRVLRVLLLLR